MQGRLMGGWAVAQSPILGTTITLDRLSKRGYKSMLSLYERVSPQLNEPLYRLLRNNYPVNNYFERKSAAPVRTVV